jgi:hypothetical protein
MKFIENVGNASTTAWRGGRKIGYRVNAAAYQDGDNIVLKLESNGSPARGFNSITMTQEQYDKFCEKQHKPLFLRAIELFGVETSWS